MAWLLWRTGRWTVGARTQKKPAGGSCWNVPGRLLGIIRVFAGAGYPPRTKCSDTSPRISTKPPTVRRFASGMACSCSAAFFQPPGARNRNRPSSTATRHRAAHRSFMRSAVVAQVLQERVVVVQHDHRLAVGEGLAVGLQAAVERVERGVADR